MELDNREQIAAGLREAAAALIGSSRCVRDVEQAVSDLVRVAVATVDSADGGGICRHERGAVCSGHATDEVISKLDDLQNTLQQGPCISAATESPPQGMVYAEDLAGAHAIERWPSFAPQAAALGYRSLLSVVTDTGRHRYASLNLYARRPDAFDADARMTATLFATQAALLLFGAESAAGLDQALRTRDEIGQAKGILMQRHRITGSQAFDRLVEASQHTNLKLTVVARWVIDEIEQPTTRHAHGTG